MTDKTETVETTETKRETRKTPMGRETTTETTTTNRPKKTERRKVIYSKSDIDAIDSVSGRIAAHVLRVLLILVAAVLVAVIVGAAVLKGMDVLFAPTAPAAEQTAPAEEAAPKVPAPDDTTPDDPAPNDPAPADEEAPESAPPTDSPGPDNAGPDSAPSVPERNMLSYVVRPNGAEPDEFIEYDFDRRQVCVLNMGSDTLPPTGCRDYAVLDNETRTTYDTLCRRYYAFAEVCPADVTTDMVLDTLERRNPELGKTVRGHHQSN